MTVGALRETRRRLVACRLPRGDGTAAPCGSAGRFFPATAVLPKLPLPATADLPPPSIFFACGGRGGGGGGGRGPGGGGGRLPILPILCFLAGGRGGGGGFLGGSLGGGGRTIVAVDDMDISFASFLLMLCY